MLIKTREARREFIRSHLGFYLGILILVTLGITALTAYCNAVYIGYSAFVCKIIDMIITLIIFSLFGLGLIYPWDKICHALIMPTISGMMVARAKKP